MRPRGHAEVDKVQADGRWERAYPGLADAVVLDRLAEALVADQAKRPPFEALTKAQRFNGLHPLMTEPTSATTHGGGRSCPRSSALVHSQAHRTATRSGEFAEHWLEFDYCFTIYL
jgi:hypothetical protein